MKLINIGFGNMVSSERVIAVVSPESAPIKRIISDSRDKGCLIDATYGRRTRAVIITDSDHVILSAIQPETVAHRIDDGGKVFYVHNRVGTNGKKVGIFKYRSMMENADKIENILSPEQLEEYFREYKIDNDPRITRVGNFLRKSSLDELPQLVNILLGQLSIVGPRPVMKDELVHYGDDVDKLLSVKPGLTGYWQAYARNNVTYESGERQRMELYYVDNQSLWFDIKIFFKTFVSVIKRDGAQ